MQDAIEADIVDKYLINSWNRKKINQDYYIDQKASLKKKLKACNRETVQIEVKPKNLQTFKIYSKQQQKVKAWLYNQLLSNHIKHTYKWTMSSKVYEQWTKLIAKILEGNKIQINTQNIQLKPILYNIYHRHKP